ncbi:MAG: Xaa-Pro aminopeptidase [Chloroflexi bacterium]|jgi:Xaa-Pro aminopeptidase|nr:MAG: Xaa-Pro aminopeptidase [Chloroflexota bacterium]
MLSRLEYLRNELNIRNLDAMLISSAENLAYLSGFLGSAGYLIITNDVAIIATDFRYLEQAKNQAPNYEVVKIGNRDQDWFVDLILRLGISNLGFEGDHVTVSLYEKLVSKIKDLKGPSSKKISLSSTVGITEEIRATKEPGELSLLQKAIDISDAAMDAIIPTIKPGDTEREVAWRLEVCMKEKGADSLAFDIIVGSGPNAALPHHRAGDRILNESESIVIDMGAKYQGYCSDLTRTIVLGSPDEKFIRIYDTVFAAQQTAMVAIQPGMTGGEADKLARTVIDEAGFAEYFGHSLGHGLGLAVHEQPVVGPNAQNTLVAGMPFTIEPGIYLPGWGGVRIEDVVLLKTEGATKLSKAATMRN